MLKLKILKRDNNKSLSKQIKDVLNDEEFKARCFRLKNNPTFEENFKLAEKIAQIDIDSIKIDNSLLENINAFSNEQIVEIARDFYHTLDKIALPDFNLEKLFEQNLKYLTIESNPNGVRSYCSVTKNPEKTERKIYVNTENRITDIEVLIHEFCHSFSKCFTDFAQISDKEMSEIPTVIIEHLTSLYLMKRFPNLKNNYIENEIYRQIVNVRKARESLLDGLIVKVMTNEITYKDAVEKYGKLFEPYPYMLESAMRRIKTYNFNNIMSENKYLIPQMIALELRDNFAYNPSNVVQELKVIIEHEHLWAQNDALKFLNIGTKSELIEKYINKFDKRILKLKQSFKKEKATLNEVDLQQ